MDISSSQVPKRNNQALEVRVRGLQSPQKSQQRQRAIVAAVAVQNKSHSSNFGWQPALTQIIGNSNLQNQLLRSPLKGGETATDSITDRKNMYQFKQLQHTNQVHPQPHSSSQQKRQLAAIVTHDFSNDKQKLKEGVAIDRLKLSIGAVSRNSQSASKDFRRNLLGRPDKQNNLNTGRAKTRGDQQSPQSNLDMQLQSPYPNSALLSNYVVTGKQSRKSQSSQDKTFFTPKNTLRIKGLNLPDLDANLAYEEHLYRQSQNGISSNKSQGTHQQKLSCMTPMNRTRTSGPVKMNANQPQNYKSQQAVAEQPKHAQGGPLDLAVKCSENVVFSVQKSAVGSIVLKRRAAQNNALKDYKSSIEQKKINHYAGTDNTNLHYSTQQSPEKRNQYELPHQQVRSVSSISYPSKKINYTYETTPKFGADVKSETQDVKIYRQMQRSVIKSQKRIDKKVVTRQPKLSQQYTQKQPDEADNSQGFRDWQIQRQSEKEQSESTLDRIKLVGPAASVSQSQSYRDKPKAGYRSTNTQQRIQEKLDKTFSDMNGGLAQGGCYLADLEDLDKKHKSAEAPKPQDFKNKLIGRENRRKAKHDLESSQFMAHQQREAARQAEKALKMIRVNQRNTKFDASFIEITKEQAFNIKHMEENMEQAEMYSESEASVYETDIREIELENEIVERIENMNQVKKLEKFQRRADFSKRARQNSMAIQFHKVKQANQFEENKLKDEQMQKYKTQDVISSAMAIVPEGTQQLFNQFFKVDNEEDELNPVNEDGITFLTKLPSKDKGTSFNAMFDPMAIMSAKKSKAPIKKHKGIQNPIIDANMKQLIQRWKEHHDTKYIDVGKKLVTNQLKQQGHIIKQLKFTEFGRNMKSEGFAKLFLKEPMLIYHRQMMEHQEICLDLITKVIDGTLVLQDYTLDSGHFAALASAIEQTQKPKIHSVYLDNCGIDDHELSLMLRGLALSKECRKFIYKNNEFNFESLQAIKPLLMFQQPQNLLELRLVNLKAPNIVLQGLLDFMIENNVHLRTLSLVQLGIKRISMNKIAKFVDESSTLEDLDLSWSDIIPIHFGPLLEVLSRNKKLKSLNLSWNMIIDKSEQNNEANFTQTSAVDEYYQRRKEAIDAGTDQVVSDADMIKNHSQQVIYSFSQLIRYNLRLQRLNLSNCGINAQVLVGIIPSLRHAKGLLCLHLTSNPGLNDEVENYYRERLHVATKHEDRNIDIDLEQIENLTDEELKQVPKEKKDVLKHKLKFIKQWKVEEVSKYQVNKRLEPLLSRKEVKIRAEGRDMSLQRFLNHKKDLPGMGQWQMETNGENNACWTCGNWNYTLIFWNTTIGDFNYINSVNIDDKAKKDVVQKIRDYNSETYRKNQNLPLFFSDVSDWQPKPFIHLLDFINSFEEQKFPMEDFEEEALYQAELKFEFNELSKVQDEPLPRPKEMNKLKEEELKIAEDAILLQEAERAKRKQRQIRTWMDGKVDEMVIEHKKGIIKNTPDIIKRILRYKRPNVLNLDQVVAGDFLDVYVLPIFLHPGSNEWVIRAPENTAVASHIKQHGRGSVKLLDYQTHEDAEFKFYYNRTVVPIRQERIPFFSKKLRRNDRLSEFMLDASVFKDWKDENEIAFGHDMKCWKMGRMTSDPEEQKQIKSIFKKNYPQLKEIFIQIISHFNNPPDIKKREFAIFCQEAGISDNLLTTGIIDTYFKATNYEEFDMDENDDNALCRFEFLEIIIRLAKGKYMDFRQITGNLSYAVSKLINSHILKMEGNLVPWQRFRREQMYDLDVNNIMEINLVNLRKLYVAITQFTKWEKKRNLMQVFNGADSPSIDQIVSFMLDKIPNLTERKIVSAFMLSKMPVSSETDNSSREYTFMKWPEFIELMPRLAHFTFVDDEDDDKKYMILADKIRHVLDYLFPLIGERLIEPPDILVVSESDDDY